MRWTIIRLIWLRDLKDQLRDRRTVFMIAVLPVLLYPLAGVGMLTIASASRARTSAVGLVGVENVLPWAPGGRPAGVGRSAAWIAAAPAAPGLAPLCAASALHLAPFELPPPLEDDPPAFPRRYLPEPTLTIQTLEGPAPATAAEVSRAPLDGRRVDVLLVFPPGFQEGLEAGRRPAVFVLARENDDASRQARARVESALARWNEGLRAARFARKGLPVDFGEAFTVAGGPPAASGPAAAREAIFSTLVRVFPFILVMWALAGALYPAVDLCAGEKERGTMETLIISPASREEIVYGKFLTIWLFSAATALLNLLSMAATSLLFSAAGPVLPGFRPAALFWAVVLLMPLSAFFSALCLAVGAYARSSKEGQYYLMPLFLGTMPLIGLTLAPGVELSPFYCMLPITGVALLLQRLVAASADGVAWSYLIPVLIPMVVYSWLALRWAISQFQSEEVLFREAERLDIALWLRKLLRDKEPWPSAGEALACFGVILLLRWVSFGLGAALPPWARMAVAQLAFVAAPPLIMAVMLTTRPAQGLGLRLSPAWAWPLAAVVAVASLPPLAELTAVILRRLPGLMPEPPASEEGSPWLAYLVIGVLPAACEELAFRGYILTGLRRGFRPVTAVLLSAFLFAVYQMNVFQFVPHFLLGVALGMLTLRAGGVLPAVLLRLIQGALLLSPPPPADAAPDAARVALALAGLVVTVAALAAAWRLGREETSPPNPLSEAERGDRKNIVSPDE